MEQDMSNEHYKIVNGERVLMTADEVREFTAYSYNTPEYIANRTGSPESTNQLNVYPSISDQLDNLWHDIDKGLLGEKAKTGNFYIRIKSVKDFNPKRG
jgi:hypothetical protein